jgi:hypothetical protein
MVFVDWLFRVGLVGQSVWVGRSVSCDQFLYLINSWNCFQICFGNENDTGFLFEASSVSLSTYTAHRRVFYIQFWNFSIVSQNHSKHQRSKSKCKFECSIPLYLQIQNWRENVKSRKFHIDCKLCMSLNIRFDCEFHYS